MPTLLRRALSAALCRPCSRPARYTPLPQRRLLMTEAIQYSIHATQACLLGLHSSTGLPWYQTFALSTVAVRLGLFPLMVEQVRNIRRAASAAPMMREAYRLYRSKITDSSVRLADKLKASRLYYGSFFLPLAVHDASALKIAGTASVNIGSFILFMYSIRGLIASGSADMSAETFFWISNMMDKDPVGALPTIAAALSYLAIGTGGSAGLGPRRSEQRSPLAVRVQDLLQTCVILALPYTLM